MCLLRPLALVAVWSDYSLCWPLRRMSAKTFKMEDEEMKNTKSSQSYIQVKNLGMELHEVQTKVSQNMMLVP